MGGAYLCLGGGRRDPGPFSTNRVLSSKFAFDAGLLKCHARRDVCAIQELNLSYYLGETLLIIYYIYYLYPLWSLNLSSLIATQFAV